MTAEFLNFGETNDSFINIYMHDTLSTYTWEDTEGPERFLEMNVIVVFSNHCLILDFLPDTSLSRNSGPCQLKHTTLVYFVAMFYWAFSAFPDSFSNALMT